MIQRYYGQEENSGKADCGKSGATRWSLEKHEGASHPSPCRRCAIAVALSNVFSKDCLSTAHSTMTRTRGCWRDVVGFVVLVVVLVAIVLIVSMRSFPNGGFHLPLPVVGGWLPGFAVASCCRCRRCRTACRPTVLQVGYVQDSISI